MPYYKVMVDDQPRNIASKDIIEVREPQDVRQMLGLPALSSASGSTDVPPAVRVEAVGNGSEDGSEAVEDGADDGIEAADGADDGIEVVDGAAAGAAKNVPNIKPARPPGREVYTRRGALFCTKNTD